jgi:hypothetical protein
MEFDIEKHNEKQSLEKELEQWKVEAEFLLKENNRLEKELEETKARLKESKKDLILLGAKHGVYLKQRPLSLQKKKPKKKQEENKAKVLSPLGMLFAMDQAICEEDPSLMEETCNNVHVDENAVLPYDSVFKPFDNVVIEEMEDGVLV